MSGGQDEAAYAAYEWEEENRACLIATWRDAVTRAERSAPVVTVGQQVATSTGLCLLAHRHPNAPLIVSLGHEKYTAVVPCRVSVQPGPQNCGGAAEAPGDAIGGDY